MKHHPNSDYSLIKNYLKSMKKLQELKLLNNLRKSAFNVNVAFKDKDVTKKYKELIKAIEDREKEII